MITMKTVYFTDDGHWFEKREEATMYEEKVDIANWTSEKIEYSNTDFLEEVIEALQTRFRFEERWDFVNPKLKPLKTNPLPESDELTDEEIF